MDFFSTILDFLTKLLDILLHIDVHLQILSESYGFYIYFLLFLIIFCETGLVVTPFLPGDSLLFAAGALAGKGILSYFILAVITLSSSVLGDAVNFRIGKIIGPPIFEKDYRFLRKDYIIKAHEFYIKNGGKTIILARFIPIIRTFAPFVAGVASMHQGKFLFFNVIGACLWVFSLLSAGYFLGSLAFVQRNFSVLVYGIILISTLPLGIKWFIYKIKSRTIYKK